MSGASALPLPEGVPGDLTSVSNTLVRVADRVGQTLLVQHGASSPVISSSWQGAAAESRAAEANTLKSRLVSASGRLPTIGTALTTYGTTLTTTIENVETWQRQWDEADETYRSRLRQLNNEPDDGLDKQSIADGWADERDNEHGRLVRLYSNAMDALRSAGRTAATTVRGQCDLVVPQGSADSRNEVGAHLLRDLPLSGGEAMSELAKDVAPDLADDLREVVASNDPDKLAAFLAEYEEYADDPYFAQAVMAELEAEGLMQTFTDLAIASERYGVQDADLHEQQQAVMSMLGTLYATASGPADGDIDPHGYNRAEIERWREEEWFPSLTEAGNATYELGDEGFAGGSYDGYWAQGLLLAAGAQAGTSPGADYMRHVGADMVAWDRAHGAYDENRDWNFAAPFHQPNLLGDEDDSAFATFANDPLHALLYAASQDEESTQALLLSPVGEGSEERTVVDYLVRERGGTMAYSQPFMDQGQLLAETVAQYGTDRTDEQSTALAGEYLNAYVDTVGSGKFANGEELSEHSFASGRTGTADVIATHIEDFIRATSMPDPSGQTYSQVPGENSFIIEFDEDTRNDFARTFGFLALDRPEDIAYFDGSEVQGDPDNPPALQRIINAAAAHNAAALADGLATFDGDWSTYPPVQALTAIDEGAGFLTYVTESAGLGLQENAEAEQAYNEYLKTMISSGAGLVPLSDLVPGGGIVDSTAGLAYSTATDAILDRVIDTDQVARAQGEVSTLDTRIQALLADQITTAVIENDAWPGEGPVAWAAERGLGPEGTFVRDGSLMPIDEILASPERTSNFFTHYLGDEYEGGQAALLALTDQVEEARAFGDAAGHQWNLR